MRLEQLSYLVEVAENNSINTAAGKLFLTPQNISKAIKQLEEELHVQLFTRSKYGMFLTAEGQLKTYRQRYLKKNPIFAQYIQRRLCFAS